MYFANTKRTIVYFLIGALGMATLSTLSPALLPRGSSVPVVLLNGDFDTPSSLVFGLKAPVRSVLPDRTTPLIQPQFIQLSEYQQGLNPLYNKTIAKDVILRHVARSHVVAILCATTTGNAGNVIDIGRSLNIPVILSVATNDALLAQAPLLSAVRLVPPDSVQATAIAKWCNTLPQPGPIHIIHDQTRYALDLRDQIVSRLTRPAVSSSIDSSTNIRSQLVAANESHIACHILLTYPPDARNITLWAASAQNTTPVLLADGCAGAWLRDIKTNFPLYMAVPQLKSGEKRFPMWPPDSQRSEVTFDPSGYKQITLEAYRFIADAAAVATTSPSIFGYIDIICVLTNSPPLFGSDKLSSITPTFSPSGENTTAAFTIVEYTDASPKP